MVKRLSNFHKGINAASLEREFLNFQNAHNSLEEKLNALDTKTVTIKNVVNASVVGSNAVQTNDNVYNLKQTITVKKTLDKTTVNSGSLIITTLSVESTIKFFALIVSVPFTGLTNFSISDGSETLVNKTDVNTLLTVQRTYLPVFKDYAQGATIAVNFTGTALAGAGFIIMEAMQYTPTISI
jgi:hypothetical protein